MAKLYTDEELAAAVAAMEEDWDLYEDGARRILDAVLPIYQQRLLKLVTKVKDDVNDRLIKENKHLKLENEKLRADLEWQQFHR